MADRQNPEPAKPDKPGGQFGGFDISALANLYGKIASSGSSEPRISLAFREPAHQAFAQLAIQKGYCQEKDVTEIVNRYTPFPEFFEHINTILANRREKFSTLSELYFAICHAQIYGDSRRYIVKCLELTKDIQDERVFDSSWKVLKASSHKMQNATDEVIAAQVARVRKVATDYFAIMKSGYLSEYRFDEVEIALQRSSDPEHDLRLITDFKMGPKLSVATLTRYYDDGHHYISYAKHPEYFGAESYSSEKPISSEELALRDHLAKLKHHPPLEYNEQLISDLLRCSVAIRSSLVDIIGIFCRDNLDFEYFRTLVDTVTNGSGEDPSLQQLLRVLPAYGGREAIVAILILEDLVRGNSGQLADALPYFEKGDLASLEQAMYRRRLEQHAGQFPEKPLPEVRAAFLAKENQDSETVDEGELDRALAKYNRILEAGEKLRHLFKAEIVVQLKELCSISDKSQDSDGFQIQYFALSRELFKHQFGTYPYNTQLIAILLLTSTRGPLSLTQLPDSTDRGLYAQIKTGEGKSLIISLTAAYLGTQSRKVDIITSNPYLARRDSLRFKQFFDAMNLTSGSFDYHEPGNALSANPSILYTTNQDLIFTYLKLRLANAPFFENSRFDVALVDEADNLCIDLTQEACRIAQEAPALFPANVYQKFLDFVDRHGREVILGSFAESVSSFCEYCPEVAHIHPIYIGLYLNSAVRSAQVRENRDYVIVDKKIVIVDVENTGRLKAKTHWANGLHEFVTLRNNLTLPSHMGVSAQLNHPAFIKKYKSLVCVSGTFGDETDRSEMAEVYGLKGFDVPTHYASRRNDYPVSLLKNRASWMERIGQWADEFAHGKEPRPLLVVVESIEDSIAIHKFLTDRGHACQLLNDFKNLDESGFQRKEDEIIRRAGGAGLITVATSVAGRGADIIPNEAAKSAGGVHALLTFIPINKRVEYQARGRSGRQGAPGSSEILACAESDSFMNSLPPQARTFILDAFDRHGPDSSEVQAAIEFSRRSHNIFGSFHRRLMLEKDELIQRAMETYFSSLAAVADDLEEHNSIFKQYRDSGLSSYVASLYLSEKWTQEFDQFDHAIRYQHLFDDSEPVIATEAESPDIKHALEALRNAFVRTFGVEPNKPGELNSAFMSTANDLYRRMGMGLVRQQTVLRKLDPDRIEGLIDDLTQKVSRMTQECFSRFKGSSEFEIKRFLDDEKKKRKDKEQDT